MATPRVLGSDWHHAKRNRYLDSWLQDPDPALRLHAIADALWRSDSWQQANQIMKRLRGVGDFCGSQVQEALATPGATPQAHGTRHTARRV